MLHAFLPHKFVDHTHATAVLSVIDQPDGEAKMRRGFRRPAGLRALSHAGLRPRQKGDRGLRARQAERRAHPEQARHRHLRRQRARSLRAHDRDGVAAPRILSRATARLSPSPRLRARHRRRSRQVAPIVRGACSEKDEQIEGAWRRLVLEFRASDAVLQFLQRQRSGRLQSRAGVVTPDHTIRTKNWPLVLPHPEAGKLDDFARAAPRGGAPIRRALSRLFRAPQQTRRRHQARARSPAPRRAGAGLGLFGLGRTKRDAAIAADIAEALDRRSSATPKRIGRFESISEADMFDCEYWPLEQAKLGARRRAAARRPDRRDHRRRRRDRRRDRQGVRRGRRRSRAARRRILPPRADKRSDRPGRAAGRLRRDRRRLRARGLRRGGRNISAASISSSRMPAPPGRAASARSTKKSCAKASS